MILQSKKVLIVGAGLIGTSIALGLKSASIQVWVEDEDPQIEEITQNLLSQKGLIPTDIDIVIVATPVSAIPGLIKEYGTRYPQAILIEIGGLKSELLQEIQDFPEIAERFCATHPMAGREIAGPLAARGDLFEGRIWILSPLSESRALSTALDLVKTLGATPVELNPYEHDRVIAGISHLPQIVSSLLALTLEDLNREELGLSGQGLRDVSRLAASKPELWSVLLHGNSASLKPFIDKYIKNLTDLSTALENDDQRKTEELLALAGDVHRRIPGKHGGKKHDYWYLPIVIDDRPGQLAALFAICSEIGVNVEDLSLEHTPGLENGMATLALSKSDAEKLHQRLDADGWKVHLPRESMG